MTRKQERDHLRQREGGMWAPTSHHRGKWSSWVSVSMIAVGSVAIGVALVLGLSVPLLIVGVALIVLGFLAGLVFDMMGDVVLDEKLKDTEPLNPLKAQRQRRNQSGSPHPA
ncbi:hypothetical protein J4H86_14655 [Spiractinospora alimapuensis]|uniref:hypothetical protein n=1 Tax=Spiractinospora alimapuensis TaxID=2820884 RepID=UPI001F26A479|nr:hypothetical protein [Spiractinospora alimapuensis]QVQ50195.1 hypothetical protein J4H86_14655 [Spiractinospora alimapuensis]